MIGKYLNHYNQAVNPDTRPEPGWDQWRALLSPLSYYDYDVSANGKRIHRGSGDRSYQTTYLNRKATDLAKRWVKKPDPFFVWLTPHAPHGEKRKTSGGTCSGKAVPAPGDEDLFGSAQLPRPPSFNERKIGDKPRFMRKLPRLKDGEIAELERNHRCRLASLREVDRGVKSLHHVVRKAGELDNTIILFTSDNGLFGGEHRLKGGKRLPYREAYEVPMAALIGKDVIAGGGPGRVGEPVAGIDLAPTFLELAGGQPCESAGDCRRMDGRSLVSLLEGGGLPGNRGLLVEMQNCSYRAIQADDQLYVEHRTTPVRATRTGGCRDREAVERYDLDADPFQLRNLGAGGVSPGLVTRLHELRDCSGIPGREPPPPPGIAYCE